LTGASLILYKGLVKWQCGGKFITTQPSSKLSSFLLILMCCQWIDTLKHLSVVHTTCVDIITHSISGRTCCLARFDTCTSNTSSVVLSALPRFCSTCQQSVDVSTLIDHLHFYNRLLIWQNQSMSDLLISLWVAILRNVWSLSGRTSFIHWWQVTQICNIRWKCRQSLQ